MHVLTTPSCWRKRGGPWRTSTRCFGTKNTAELTSTALKDLATSGACTSKPPNQRHVLCQNTTLGSRERADWTDIASGTSPPGYGGECNSSGIILMTSVLRSMTTGRHCQRHRRHVRRGSDDARQMMLYRRENMHTRHSHHHQQVPSLRRHRSVQSFNLPIWTINRKYNILNSSK